MNCSRVSKRLLCALGALSACALTLTGCAPGKGGAAGPEMQGLSWVTFDVSPDEKTVVFSSTGQGGLGLYLLDLTTNKVTRFVDTPAYENYPAFSPDGKSVVYQSAKDLSAPRFLFIRSLDGKSVRQLTNTPDVADDHPSFSPDGKRIVFARSQYFHDGKRGENTWSDFDVFLINRNGSGLRQLTHFKSQGVIRPEFCPDNRHILYEHTTISGTPATGMTDQTFIEELDTAHPSIVRKVVQFGSYGDWSPYPTPDGRSLIFFSNLAGTMDLYRVSMQGGTPQPVLAGDRGTGYTDPVVTRDGRHIYCKGVFGPTLVMMNANGSGPRQIAGRDLFSDPMHWKP